MGLHSLRTVLYYGILASVTGGWLPLRAKNCWLTVFHIYLILAFIIFPLAVAFVSVISIAGAAPVINYEIFVVMVVIIDIPIPC